MMNRALHGPPGRGGAAPTSLRLSGRTIDFAASIVTAPEGEIRLSPTEWRLLRCLAVHLGETLPRDRLHGEVWEGDAGVDIRVVDSTVRRLRSKLEVNPGAPRHIVSVYREGYRLEASLDAPTDEPSGPSLSVAAARPEGGGSSTLPSEGGPILGRDAILARSIERVRRGERIVSFVGPAGVGKTRLALAVALALEAEAGAVWFCDLGSAQRGEEVVHRVTELTGPRDLRADPASLAAEIATRGPALLVLDNVERVVRACHDLLAGLLEGAPELRVLVTSRVAPSLRVGAVVNVPPLDTAAGVALFEERAGRAWPPGTLEPLVDHLDGLPLAIELAANRAAVLAPSQLIERLEHRFRLLRDPLRPDEPRRGSLRSTLDLSWDLLEPLDRAVLAGCAVFEGGFTVDAVEAVVEVDAPEGSVLDAVQRLVAHSLATPVAVVAGRGERRLRLLDSVRHYAAERRADVGLDPRRLRAAHSRWYGRLARAAVEAIRVGADTTELHHLALEADNLRAVARGAEEVAAEDAAWACMALAEHHCAVGPRELALRAADEGVAWAERAGRPAIRSEALLTRAVTVYLLRQRHVADEDTEPALALAREIGDHRLVVRVLLQLLVARANVGQVEEAAATVGEALEVARRAEYVAGVARAEAFTAWLHLRLERPSEAATWAARALGTYAALGPSRGHALAHNTLAFADLQLDRVDAAWRSIEAARVMSHDVGYEPGVLVSASMSATALILEGRYAEARVRLEGCAAVARAKGRAVAGAVATCNRVLCDLGEGRLASAITDIEGAMAVALASRDWPLVRRLLCVKAAVQLVAGDLAGARSTLSPALFGPIAGPARGLAGLVRRLRQAAGVELSDASPPEGPLHIWEGRVIERVLARLPGEVSAG